VPHPVHLLSLTLRGVRNHRDTRLDPGSAPLVVLAGPNGAGKTNILEAISLLAPGRGLRGASLSEMAMAGGDGSLALAALLSPDPALPPLSVKAFTTPEAPDRRRLTINGAVAAAASLPDWLSVLWITPAMDRLFADAAAQRRRFLDRLALALFPAHGRHASRYEAALRARGRLLAEGRPDPAWLTALEAQMSEHGTALADGRRQLVAVLSARLDRTAPGAFPMARLALAGDSPDADWPRLLSAARAADAVAGRATRAPHRVDLAVTHADKDMPAAQASTGEQKALLVGILLAHADLAADRTGRVPLLLLDEAAAHLDPDRRRALFGRLLALGGQAWLTGTEMPLFDGLPEASRFAVAGGAVTAA
jgi:DNA replication and repair protein RecF